MEMTRRGSFILPDGAKSSPLDVHITEIIRAPDEAGLSSYTGWAAVPADFGARLMKHWVETDGEAELVLDNGSSVPITITNMKANENGRTMVRFLRRSA